jgi:hypothetical protein
MDGRDKYYKIYISWSLVFQLSLLTLFSIRKVNLEIIYQYGLIFYALSIPAVIVSIVIMRGGRLISYWLAGFTFLAWAILGFVVEYLLGIQWRNPVNWFIFLPYICLYLTTVMFYWWPIANLNRSLWFLYSAMFVISTYLNITSH